jgi:uracil-DNA glycosylase
MSSSFDLMLDQVHRGKPAMQLLELSPAVLKGVSEGDAQHLRDAFGIQTIRQLAELRFSGWARAIFAAARGLPGFDPGPPPDWEIFFAAAPIDHYVQHPSQRFRLDFGPVYYRGRLDGTARVIVVGQDPAANEILAHRVFVGSSGQRVQGLLAKLGLTRSYTMLNTFLFSIFQQFDPEMRNISLEPEVLGHRNAFLDRLAAQNPIQAVIAVGGGARHAVDQWPGAQALPVFEISHPAALDQAALLATWNNALPGLQAGVEADDDGQVDPTPYGNAFTPQDHVAIPRHDLPFGLPDWHGVGSHGSRDGNKKIIWNAP